MLQKGLSNILIQDWAQKYNTLILSTHLYVSKGISIFYQPELDLKFLKTNNMNMK